MEEAINAWEKERDTAQNWVKCHIKSILHPKMPQIGTFNDLFQLIIHKFINYQSKWCSVHSLKFPGCGPLPQGVRADPHGDASWSNQLSRPPTATTWRPQKLLRLKNGTKTKIQIYFLIFIVGPSLAPRRSARGKRMHGMGNGTVVLKHNANLKVYIHQSQHLFVTASLSIYVWYNKNHAAIHYWSQQLVLLRTPPSLHQPTNQPTQTRPPNLAWKKRRSNNSISCQKSSSKKYLKKIAGELPGKIFKKSSWYENLLLVKSLIYQYFMHGTNLPNVPGFQDTTQSSWRPKNPPTPPEAPPRW